MLFDSIQKIRALNPDLRLYPGHGSGSACGKAIGSGNFCDLKTQGEKNYAFLIKDRAEFVAALLKNIVNPPKYFFHDANLNQIGIVDNYEATIKKLCIPKSKADFEKYISSGKTVIDVRE